MTLNIDEIIEIILNLKNSKSIYNVCMLNKKIVNLCKENKAIKKHIKSIIEKEKRIIISDNILEKHLKEKEIERLKHDLIYQHLFW